MIQKRPWRGVPLGLCETCKDLEEYRHRQKGEGLKQDSTAQEGEWPGFMTRKMRDETHGWIKEEEKEGKEEEIEEVKGGENESVTERQVTRWKDAIKKKVARQQVTPETSETEGGDTSDSEDYKAMYRHPDLL